MRFKSGSKVEVMCNKEVPASWRSAEIISGNGRTYRVKYDCFRGSETEDFVARVPRKAMRPCPPPVEGVQLCMVGDFVEVFDNVSWKAAAVLKSVDSDHLLVRLDDVHQKLRVHKSNIRVRLSWKDDKWVAIGKNPRPYEDNVGVGLPKSCMVSSRPLKRAFPYSSSACGSSTGNIRKRSAVEKEGRQQRFAAVPFCNEVDAVAYPGESLGGTYMHTSYKSNGEYNFVKTRLSPWVGCSFGRRSEPTGSDSDACSSVGSCSITSEIPNKFLSHEVTDTLCSAGVRDQENCCFPPEEEVAASIHRLELHAYHRTLEAFYASGTLSWEQEALLTNLRIMLHISNDEHLVEIRNLISSGSGILTS